MSITPVGEDGAGGQENRELACDQRQGVRARVRSWLQSIGRRLRKVSQLSRDSASNSSTERSADRHKGEIRVSGQRRLEGSQRAESVELATVRPELPGTGDDNTERDGNRLHNPDRPAAYITSDTWEDVER